MNWSDYETDGFYDELFNPDGTVREVARPLFDRFESLSDREIGRRQKAAQAALLEAGITFAVYGDKKGAEKIFPFDIVPRIVEADDWAKIEAGLQQRIEALNAFIDDIYHDQRILNEGIIPKDLILSGAAYRKECIGLNPPRGVWCHITGTDLIRHSDGVMYVLEDNLRCPSGVSYVLENRQILKRTFPLAFGALPVCPVDDYPNQLKETLVGLAPEHVSNPTVAILTPGPFNSAYFEHSFLSKQMGVELVQGSDLVVVDGFVQMKTTSGMKRVDVIYRRVDDDFLDPACFRKDSMLGVKGIMDVYRNGRIALANAPGTGVADDKAVYAYVPDIIKFYMGQDAIIPNVPTYICAREDDCKYVLENLESLVVKPVNESGGYGMIIGPKSTAAEREDFAGRIRQNPRNYVAQPTMALSRVPTLIDGELEGRHVDLRPYILYGESVQVMPGGLTRVALPKGSLVVNSSQGGGSKDTWVLAAPDAPESTPVSIGQTSTQEQSQC